MTLRTPLAGAVIHEILVAHEACLVLPRHPLEVQLRILVAADPGAPDVVLDRVGRLDGREVAGHARHVDRVVFFVAG